MASNRSNAKSRSAAQPASADTPKDALAAVARHTARVHLRELTTLPCAAADHFDTRLLRVSIDK